MTSPKRRVPGKDDPLVDPTPTVALRPGAIGASQGDESAPPSTSTPGPPRRRLGAGGLTGAASATPGLTPRPPVRSSAGSAGVSDPSRRPGAARTAPSRPIAGGPLPEAGRPVGRSRRAKLALQRIDPWSVFVFTLVASLFLGVALVVAVAALYSVLGSLGVLSSVNELYVEVIGGDAGAEPLFTANRFLGGAAVLAAVNVVLLTLLATLGSLLYNLCASFTGGIEVTLGERE